MIIVALAGGYGTRLGDLTKDTPKALLDVNGTPLLTYMLSRINKVEDATRLVLVTNDKFYDVLQEWATSVKSRIPITVLNDKTTCNEDRLGSIGDTLFAIDELKIDEPILLIGTDNFFTFDINPIVLRGKELGCSVVGLYDVKDVAVARNFGIAQLDANDKIVSLVEKPAQPQSTLSSIFLYYIVSEDFDHIRQCVAVGKSDKMGECIAYLVEHSTVYGLVHDRPFYDIGSLQAYQQLQDDLKALRL